MASSCSQSYGATEGGLCFAQEGGQAGKEAQQAEQQQEQAKPKQEEPTQPAGQYVEEITVTAQKRPEDIQKIPLAVSTLSGSGSQHSPHGRSGYPRHLGRVPSLTLESSFGRAFPRFYMRGLGNSDFDLNASQPVSMVVDEVVMENPIVKGMPLFDLDRIEVLRGPQGTLFGRNTPAGVIKFDTKRPTKDFDANFKVSYGTYDNIDVNGGIGGALSKTISARFSALYQGQGDWVDNGTRARTTPSGATPPPPTACSSCGSRATSSAACSTSTAGTSTAPRGSSVPTSSRRGPTTWSTTSSRTSSTTTA